MRRRFSGMNQVAGGFLGDLGVDRFLERPGPTSVAREDHLRDGQILRWALREVNSILVKDRMNIVCLVRSTSQRSTTFVDQLATSACLSLLISMALTRRSTHRNRNRESCSIPGVWSAIRIGSYRGRSHRRSSSKARFPLTAHSLDFNRALPKSAVT